MRFRELLALNLPPAVWSLIQRGLNDLGLYVGTYRGRPGPKTAAAYRRYVLEEDPPDGAWAPWMIPAISQLGTKEADGPADNPDVVKYFGAVHGPFRAQGQDETAWCSAFANWCMEQVGIQGTRSAVAKTWLRWGVASDPVPGCIVVLSRGDPAGWQGHVGFLIRKTPKGVILLGGNQDDAVNETWYPDSRVLGCRIDRER